MLLKTYLAWNFSVYEEVLSYLGPMHSIVLMLIPAKAAYLTANRHLESFEPGTACIYKFSLLVSVICVTFARLHTLHHVA